MKKTFAILIISVMSSVAFGQGTFEFSIDLSGRNVVRPNESQAGGLGRATLAGLEFRLDVAFNEFFPLSATDGLIRGPAEPGSTGPALFHLGPPDRLFPLPPKEFGAIFYSKLLTISEDQKADLLAGNWYLEVLTEEYPEGHVRGQIVSVPEPSMLMLLVGGGVVVLLFATRQRKRDGFETLVERVISDRSADILVSVTESVHTRAHKNVLNCDLRRTAPLD